MSPLGTCKKTAPGVGGVGVLAAGSRAAPAAPEVGGSGLGVGCKRSLRPPASSLHTAVDPGALGLAGAAISHASV